MDDVFHLSFGKTAQPVSASLAASFLWKWQPSFILGHSPRYIL